MDRGHVDELEVIEDATQVLALRTRIGELEDEVAQLREALVRRRQYGVVTGMVAVRFGMSPERAWRFLVRLSQQNNLKMQVIARVIHDRAFGRLAPEDEALAAQLDGQLGPLWPPIMGADCAGVADEVPRHIELTAGRRIEPRRTRPVPTSSA